MHKELERAEACEAAQEWAAGFPTLQEAWESCDRAEWLLWAVLRSTKPNTAGRQRAMLLVIECLRFWLGTLKDVDQERGLQVIAMLEQVVKGERPCTELPDIYKQTYQWWDDSPSPESDLAYCAKQCVEHESAFSSRCANEISTAFDGGSYYRIQAAMAVLIRASYPVCPLADTPA